MYLNYFGLNSWPFKTTPELKMFFKDGSRAEILEALAYTISRGDGIVKVTGEVGSGKTMLLRLLASKLPESTEIIYINSPNLSAKDILLYICSELKIDISDFNEKFSLTNALKNRLVELHSKGHKVVMLIDEAQVMTFDALEEIRLLSNIETGEDKLLQMVLFGQPELDIAMENDRIRQIKSRISYSIYVPPLSVKEVHSYLNYRMRQAGYKGLDVFNFKVAKRIHKLSSGLPRTINVIADKLLMACFGQDERAINKTHFKSLTEYSGNSIFRNLWVLGSLISTLLLIFIFVYRYELLEHKNHRIATTNNTNVIDSESSVVETTNNNYGAASTEVVDRDLPVEVNDALASKPLSNGNQVNSNLSILNKKNVNLTNQNGSNIAESKVESQSDENFNVKKNLAQHVNLDEISLMEPFLSIHKRGQLKGLLMEHQRSIDLLNNHNKRYMIQLSTRNIASLQTTYEFYKKSNFNLDDLYILIDFNKRVGVYRIKVFFSGSNSFSAISSEIESLPEKVKKESPYVVRVSSVKEKLNQTQMKLKNVGIIDE